MQKNLVRKHLESQVRHLSECVAHEENIYLEALEAYKESPDIFRGSYKDFYKSRLDMFQYALAELRTVLEILDMEEKSDLCK